MAVELKFSVTIHNKDGTTQEYVASKASWDGRAVKLTTGDGTVEIPGGTFTKFSMKNLKG